MPGDNIKVLKNLLMVLSTGAVLVFFSEHLFWAHVREGDSLLNWVSTWLAYSFVAFIFLTSIAWFRVRSIWAIFLTGSIVGWLTEGVLVQTAYDMLPFSISFTGLAWHALITVWTGWYALQKALRAPKPWRTVLIASLIGIVYGLWAVSWWQEPDGRVTSLASFAAFTLIATTLAALAYWTAGWSSTATFTPSRWVAVIAGFLIFAYTVLVTIPARPVAALLLPILLGVTYWGLRQNQKVEPPGSILDAFASPPPLRNLAALFCLPLVSIAFYAFAQLFDLKIHINMVFYLVTMPLGFILFFISLFKVVRRAQKSRKNQAYNIETSRTES